MLARTRKILVAGMLTLVGTAGISSPTFAQQPTQQPQQQEGIEVLARGPVHEAFAATSEQPKPTPVLNRRPPEPVEELPPDQKPEGENVLWVPGYWHYDEERTDFIWISGFWRAAPPGRIWVPGSWREVAGGHQWVQGFWQDAAPTTGNRTQEPMIEYLPEPPQPLELAPSIPAPDTTSFYVSGSWVWRDRYVWRPGFWIGHRPGWVWTPSCYRWTPAGYVFVDGFWDYPLHSRGTLFAPVFFRPGFIRPSYFYTPTYVVHEPSLYTSLFVRSGWGNYYFGDYYDRRYSTIGFNAWYGSGGGSGFAIGVGFGGGRRYDPLWDYYRIQNLNNPGWAVGINNVYAGRFNGSIPRPPRTLVQQTTIINNITNVTNNTVNNTVVNNTTNNRNSNNANNLMMLTNLKDVSKTNTNIVLKPVSKEQLVTEQATAKELRNVAAQRQRLETRLAQNDGIPKIAPAGRGGIAPQPKIQSIQLDAPKQALARAQIPQDERKAPPPNPARLKADASANPAGANAKPIAPAINPKPGNAMPANPTNPTPVPTPKPGTPLPRGGEVKPINPAPVPAPKPGTPVPRGGEVKPNNPAPVPTPKPGTPLPRGGEVKPNNPAPVPTPKPGTPLPRGGEVKPINPAPVPAPKPGTPLPRGGQVVPNNPAPVPVPKPGTPAPRGGQVVPNNPAPVPAPKPGTPAPRGGQVKPINPAPTIKPPVSNPMSTPAPQVVNRPANPVPQPAPRQIAPPQPAPRQIAPPQPAPRQIAPPQPAPRQIAPPQPAPRQIAPPQQAPRQIAPPRQAPQQAPRQIAPPQPAPRQIAPPKPAPQPAPRQIAPPRQISPTPKPAPPSGGKPGGNRGGNNRRGG
jgi:hypothetical protein